MSQRARLETALSDRYQLMQELGRGGTATVWLAEDLRHRRRVALKTLHPELAATLGTGRFLREIEIAAGLTHPNILPLYESGEAGGILYYAMPVVEGESLRERLVREIQLPLDEALRIAAEVADALAYAHARGVIHRDIKPENILLHNGHAVVADFGIAKALANAAGESLTATGLAVGTPAYMSPEQSAGSDHVDGRSDLYALGCVLFEMLAGEPPFSAPTPQALAAKHQQATPPKVRLTRKTVPEWVDGVIERALAKVPADRYPTAYALRQAIEQPAGSKPEPVGKSRPWTKPMLATGGAVLVGAVLAALWTRVPHVPRSLDDNRVVVFPLRAVGGSTGQSEGEAVATYVGYALDGSEPLRWLDGWDYMSQRERQALDTFSVRRATEISRKVSARYFIDGSVVRAGDSVAVVLRLHDVLGDSVVKRSGSSQPVSTADPPVLGLRAVSELLPALIEPGRAVDLHYLGDRKPLAVATFLQGERYYRRMRFDRALESYRESLAADSQMAVAAMKGAQSAMLLEHYDEAHLLARRVLSGSDALSQRYAPLAAGLLAFLDGKADSALAAFRRAIATDERSPEPWTALGETYYHLLPSESYTDSLAESAFLEAERLDSAFTPALAHLAHFAIRRDDLSRAAHLFDRMAIYEPDRSSTLKRLSLSIQCARNGPGKVDWRTAGNDSGILIPVARMLSVGGRQSQCAEAAYRAQWDDTTAPAALRWGALQGLALLLAAEGKSEELGRLLDSEASTKMGGDFLYLITSAVDPAGIPRAAQVASTYERGSPPTTAAAWILGEWQASQRDAAKLERTIAWLQEHTESRGDSVMIAALEARQALLQADTTEAIRLIRQLTPSAPPNLLEWQLWESFAPERAILAQVLARRGDWKQAAAVATQFDSPSSVLYPMYTAVALEVRLQAGRHGVPALGVMRRLAKLNPKVAAAAAHQP